MCEDGGRCLMVVLGLDLEVNGGDLWGKVEMVGIEGFVVYGWASVVDGNEEFVWGLLCWESEREKENYWKSVSMTDFGRLRSELSHLCPVPSGPGLMGEGQMKSKDL